MPLILSFLVGGTIVRISFCLIPSIHVLFPFPPCCYVCCLVPLCIRPIFLGDVNLHLRSGGILSSASFGMHVHLGLDLGGYLCEKLWTRKSRL